LRLISKVWAKNRPLSIHDAPMHANRVLAIHKVKLAGFIQNLNLASRHQKDCSITTSARSGRSSKVAQGGNLDENRNEVHPNCGIGMSCG